MMMVVVAMWLATKSSVWLDDEYELLLCVCVCVLRPRWLQLSVAQ